MNTKTQYSFIVCPACGKSFRFADDLENPLTGKVLRCPKCRSMFAFTVIDSDDLLVANTDELKDNQVHTDFENSDLSDVSFTAPVDDKNAFDEFFKDLTEESRKITEELQKQAERMKTERSKPKSFEQFLKQKSDKQEDNK